MEESKTLRDGHARLKEFESKREADAVQRLEESHDDASRLLERYKELQTEPEFEDARRLLSDSKARERMPEGESEHSVQKIQTVRRGSEGRTPETPHGSAAGAQQNFQNGKKGLVDEGRLVTEVLEGKSTPKMESEQNQQKECIDQKGARRIKIENNPSQQLAALRENPSKTSRSAKEISEKTKQAEIERSSREKSNRHEESAANNDSRIEEQITEEYEVKNSSLKEELENITSIEKEYKKTATENDAKREEQVKTIEARNRESARQIVELEDKVKNVEGNGSGALSGGAALQCSDRSDSSPFSAGNGLRLVVFRAKDEICSARYSLKKARVGWVS